MNVAKPTLIVWGGSWTERDTPLSPETIDSHAAVVAYFLSAALAEYYTVIPIITFDGIEGALAHDDAVLVLSTFQAGFTRLQKDKPDVFAQLQQKFAGKLASVVDFVSFHPYAEDRLFTVLPKRCGPKAWLKRRRAGAKVASMGWCASVDYCAPEKVAEDAFHIFLDHGHYCGEDFTHIYVDALNLIHEELAAHKVRVFFQGNQGVEQWPLGKAWTGETYNRQAKVPWNQMIARYQTSHIFCLTHQESAGLAAIEAAMCGAKLYVPERQGSAFIKQELLDSSVDYAIVPCAPEAIAKALLSDVKAGVDRQKNHQRVQALHDWNVAAKRIYAAVGV